MIFIWVTSVHLEAKPKLEFTFLLALELKWACTPPQRNQTIWDNKPGLAWMCPLKFYRTFPKQKWEKDAKSNSWCSLDPAEAKTIGQKTPQQPLSKTFPLKREGVSESDSRTTQLWRFTPNPLYGPKQGQMARTTNQCQSSLKKKHSLSVNNRHQQNLSQAIWARIFWWMRWSLSFYLNQSASCGQPQTLSRPVSHFTSTPFTMLHRDCWMIICSLTTLVQSKNTYQTRGNHIKTHHKLTLRTLNVYAWAKSYHFLTVKPKRAEEGSWL